MTLDSSTLSTILILVGIAVMLIGLNYSQHLTNRVLEQQRED